ncbi:MAG: hypothetical protein Fur0012_14080 [Elusimicrobiota bacterium]
MLNLLPVEEPAGMDLFSARERESFESFKSPKRKMEWYWARVAAKQLLSEVFSENPAKIEILSNKDRAPYAVLKGRKIPISLSHRENLCGCAVTISGHVGLDIEKKEKKDLSLFSEYLDEAEYSYCISHPDSFSAVWALKEASLKMLGLGLSVSAKEAAVREKDIIFSGRALEKAILLGAEKPNFELIEKDDYHIALTWSDA